MNRWILEETTVEPGGIPVIACYSEIDEARPLVLLNHGTTGCAYDMLPMAVKLAQAGHFCVCVDAVWHGRRSDGKLAERLEPAVYKKNYLNLLLTMAGDMTRLIDYYTGDARVNAAKVGITGISQGGYVAFMTMTKDPRIAAAAPLIGSPDLEDKYGNSPDWQSICQSTREEVIAHSPLRHFEKMHPTALFVQSGVEDTIVPVGGTRRLDERLRPLYREHPGDYRYIEYPGVAHAATREMQDEAIRWLTAKLK